MGIEVTDHEQLWCNDVTPPKILSPNRYRTLRTAKTDVMILRIGLEIQKGQQRTFIPIAASGATLHKTFDKNGG